MFDHQPNGCWIEVTSLKSRCSIESCSLGAMNVVFTSVKKTTYAMPRVITKSSKKWNMIAASVP